MNIPNYITLLRIILIPFFINLMIYGYYRSALGVFVIACVTDALDGMIARITHSQTDLGAFLDPMADKLLIVSAFVTLVLLHMLPIWLVIIVVSRDIILVIGSAVIYFTGHDLKARPSLVGKATTVLQLAVVTLSLLLKSYGVSVGVMSLFYGITAVFTVASGVQYVTRGVKIVEEDIS
ncbi:MAG TPA: CDP-diacylglycerol--glycerol-3-phosphate 3-phosphatidyltransferase [Nitrospirota bacterium]|nr:CDP-diacylglycerol--glycerol-3-phosphate 3-phosphatidyltransferase [Nitrospirota bacterium]